MKRLLFALSLAITAPLPAQVEYKFTDFVLTQIGFTSRLLFRNTNSYSDARMFGITGVSVSLAPRYDAPCPHLTSQCNWLNTPNSFTVGAAQSGTFVNGTNVYLFSGLVEDTCAAFCPITFSTFIGGGSGVLGCPLYPSGPVSPPGLYNPRTYSGRICAADGLDGWAAVDLIFFATITLPFVPNVNDLLATFTTRDLGPNTVVPEPATWALLFVGLVGVRAVRRKRIS